MHLTKEIRLYLLLILISLNVSAQVTIGSSSKPNVGTLLDLKEWDQADGGMNAEKGLLLPRVDLVKNNLTLLGLEADATGYEGMIVYNVTDKDGMCPGLHVWTGKSWTPLFTLTVTPDVSSENLEESTGLGTLTDREGTIYRVAKFGDDWWMTQNLASKTIYDHCYRVVPIELHTENKRGTPQYFYPNKDSNSPKEYGLLYNWAAASNRKGGDDGQKLIPEESENGSTNIEFVGVKGICPRGWHLPSDLEWNRLEQEISTNPQKYATDYGIIMNWQTVFNTTMGTPRGGHQRAMRSTSTATPGTIAGFSKSAENGGFDAFSVGSASYNMPSSYGTSAIFWTSSARGDGNNTTAAFYRSMSATTLGVHRGIADRRALYSVRCKKDKE